MPTPFVLHRRPRTGTGDLRLLLRARVENELAAQGHLARQLRFVGDGYDEVGLLPSGLSDAEAATLWAHLAERPGTAASFREGPVVLPEGPAVAIVERGGGWATWRLLDERLWRSTAAEARPAALDAWLVAPGEARAGHVRPRPPVLEVERLGGVPSGLPTPASVKDLLAAAVAVVEPEVRAFGLDHVIVIAYAGTEAYRWEIRGTLPCSPDELARFVAAEQHADGLAVAWPSTGPSAEPGVTVTVEIGGWRASRWSSSTSATRARGPLPAGADTWIGAPPDSATRAALAPLLEW